ncbi:MAG: carboxymuconolactone decarboxylase family protein [Candidatus Methanomethylicia archaeon]|nr:carboxymuconolactone decarboxylase family protein [Candidatus Methanomethylicia archaeon]
MPEETKALTGKFVKKMGFAPEIMHIAAEIDPKLTQFYDFCDKVVQNDGALPSKFKLLLIMAMGAQRHCEECVVSAMRGAYNKGATEEEILEAVRAIAVAGGAPAITACKDALVMLKEKSFDKAGCGKR